MTRAGRPDTNADRELTRCVSSVPAQSFLMTAGAGSGKTTSLIKCLQKVLENHGKEMKLNRRKVACITYTDVAANEIWADVGKNDLVKVSTIHSFLWTLVQGLQKDIQNWVIHRIDQKITDLMNAASSFGPRVRSSTREKNQQDIDRYQYERTEIQNVHTFVYGKGSDYLKGILGHDDIIKMVPDLLFEKPLMRILLAQKFPFVFVDESQDTFENVVLALKSVEREHRDRFCLGFFGDPMQRIFPSGIGEIPAEPEWSIITKPENFRCPSSVLRIANAIRRTGDGLVQLGGRMVGEGDNRISLEGEAHIFVFPIDEHRDERILKVRDWIARKSNDQLWGRTATEGSIKLLVIVHRMAANRLGFGDLYSALNDKAPEKFKNGFLDGTAWPIRGFAQSIVPLVNSMDNENDFEVMRIIREYSPLLDRSRLNHIDVANVLQRVRASATRLQEMMSVGSTSTIREVLEHIHQSQIFDLDAKICAHLNLTVETEETTDVDEEDEEEANKEVVSMGAFLACHAYQVKSYCGYVNQASPFSTHQGVKGAEFERVLVILDDDEGRHNQFSYDKYFGLKPLSATDNTNAAEGLETSIDRTRRLFYVCCTRALKDLAVVLFTENVELACQRIALMEIFSNDEIHSLDDPDLQI